MGEFLRGRRMGGGSSRPSSSARWFEDNWDLIRDRR